MVNAGVFMRKLLFLLVYVCCAGFASPVAVSLAETSSSEKILVEDITAEPMNYADSEYTWLNVSCTVENLTDKSGTVSVVVGTIDHWAFDRKPFRLTGFVKAGGKARLSVLDFMDSKMFKTIKRYEVKSVELH